MSRSLLVLLLALAGLPSTRALAQTGDAMETPAAAASDDDAVPDGDARPDDDAGTEDAPRDEDHPPVAHPEADDAAEGHAAEGDTPEGDTPEGESEGEAEAAEEPFASITFHGALEAAYGYNFNDPSNGVTAWRWYDNRHDLLGLQGALLSANWEAGPVTGTLQLQFGVLGELFWDGTRSIEQDLLWRLIQQATTEWHTPHDALSIEGGVFNVPFGPEYNNAYLNWNWSTSNLFALMPYQVAGFRANYDLGGGLTARLGLFNGWDQIISDNNGDKSVMVSLEWDDPSDEDNYVYFNYMVGVERDTGDARGADARHTFDAYAQWHAADPFFVRGHVFGGFEPGQPGTDGWLGVALFARVEPHETFAISVRGDAVRTFAGAENLFHADTLALVDRPLNTSTLLGSGTLTLDYHPFDFASLRLEIRHDRADFPLFFAGEVPKGPPNMPDPEGEDRPTATEQTTLTAGLTTWF